MSNKTRIHEKSKVISISYIAVLLEYCHQFGGTVNQLLKGSNIHQDSVVKKDVYISFLQFEAVIQNALVMSQQPELGLYYGQQLNLTSHGELGIAVMSSATLQEALMVGIKYLAIRNPHIILKCDIQDELASVLVTIKFARGEVKRFLTDMTMASLHCMRKFLLGEEASDGKVYFSYPEPKDNQAYLNFFGYKVFFNQETDVYCFPRSELKYQLPLANPETRQIAEEECQKKLRQLENKEGLMIQVEQLLLARPGYFPSLEEVAARLFVSSRTLKRQLKQLDTSYQQILNQLRQSLALEYLQSTQLSIAEIADLLNYSDPSNFANAFKRWTGKSPSQFQTKKIASRE